MTELLAFSVRGVAWDRQRFSLDGGRLPVLKLQLRYIHSDHL